MPPEHPLRYFEHVDWVDHYAAVPRVEREQFKCPKCGSLTKKNICNGGTRADSAYCDKCRIEFAIAPTWHERLMELRAEKPGKIIRDDSNTIVFRAETTATNSTTLISLGSNYGTTPTRTFT